MKINVFAFFFVTKSLDGSPMGAYGNDPAQFPPMDVPTKKSKLHKHKKMRQANH